MTDGPQSEHGIGFIGGGIVFRRTVATRRLGRQIRLWMAVDPQMWGLAACLPASADTDAGPGPTLRIIAAGNPRPLEFEAIRTWM